MKQGISKGINGVTWRAALAALCIGTSGSAGAADVDPPLWQARELFELYRPTMQPRELSREEREEVRALLKLHRESDDAEWLAWHAEQGTIKPPRRQATLLRLIELGESGDKEAMLAARTAMAGAGQGLGWGVDAPFRVDVSHPDEDNYAEYLANALVGHWTALIWKMHGPERSREARTGLSQCMAQYNYVTQYNDTFSGRTYLVDCGFTLKISDAFKKSKDASRMATHSVSYLAEKYVEDGGKPPFEIVSVYGLPSDTATQAALYDRLVKSWRRCDAADPLGIKCGLTLGQRAWVEHYAQVNNRVSDLYNAEEIARKKDELDRINAEYYAREAVRRKRDADLAEWEQGMKKLPAGTHAAQRHNPVLEALSARLGDEYLERFAAHFVVLADENIRRLCNAGSASCRAQLELQQQRFELYAAQEAERRAAASAASRAPLPSPSVNVRSYDQNGNYMGSETMTRGEAELRGAK